MKAPSLRLKLTFFISGILLLACVVTTSISYFELKSSLGQVFDSQQLLFAKRLAAFNSHSNMMSSIKPTPPEIDLVMDYDDDALSFAIFNRRGEMIVSDGAAGRRFTFEGGFFFKDRNRAMVEETDKWRILWLLSNDNRSIIAVGQKLDYQQGILFELLYKQLIPWLITFVVVIIFAIVLIGRSFIPINTLANKIAERKPDDDSAIDLKHIPKEISPFIIALNALFAKIATMITRERQFISDAAHELRTPLAALRVQIEVAQLSDDDKPSRDRALNNLIQGIDRTTRLVEQLLILSRLDTLETQYELQNVKWNETITNVVDELKPLADEKQILISIIEQVSDVSIKANPILLAILVRNLINNAIRYIPENSHIEVTIAKNKVCFEDSGNGVDDEVLTRLGERFYRPAGQKEKGSGLGLSIVKKIADIHHIDVQFENSLHGGFKVILMF